MVSNSHSPPIPGSKRRRLRGSCDHCKKRKTRPIRAAVYSEKIGDSAQMPGLKCSNCIAFNSECTHTRTSKSTTLQESRPPNKVPSPTPSDSNKTAKAHVAAIVQQATSYIADADVRHVLLDIALYARSLENELAPSRRSPSLSCSLGSADSPSDVVIKEEENTAFVNGILTERFNRFSLDSEVDRYFGKSSHFDLINTAIDVRDLTKNHKKNHPPMKRAIFWRSPPPHRKWEYDHLAPEEVFPPLIFPPPDLLRSLVDLFFTRVNIILLLIHRPSFEKALASGLHLVDHQFGSTVLGICALAAKYSDDPRVMLEGTNSALSAGWKYVCQLQPVQKPLMRSFTLYEAQTLCLFVLYLQGSSAPDGCWGIGGTAVRYAQEAGVHRRNRYNDPILDEQWKRVFWLFICIDTLSSSFCGRPRATSSDDYDVEYPVECDDEYWESSDPSQAFKQPPGKPSIVSYFVAYLKLIEIMGMAQRSIYLLNHKNRSEQWTHDAVATIDSALNAWIDAIPAHLRWDPHMKNVTFATQSAVLYASYYHVQIQVHRIFLVSPVTLAAQQRNTFNRASLALCANSARVCSHVMDVAAQRGLIPDPHALNAVFDSCILLLLSVWGGKCVGLTVDPQKCLQDVEACLRVFRVYEKRWQIAGRQYDIIMELMSAANMDVQFSSNPSNPEREDYVEASANNLTPESQSSFEEPSLDKEIPSSAASSLDMDTSCALPMYTEDLSRLPIYEPLNWDTHDWASWGKDLQNDIPQYIVPETLGSEAVLADSMAVLNEVPWGSDWDNWGKYITSVEELMHSLQPTS
ncbi:Fungal-trans domain-containing protein [Mycena sanguinolenta]|uniref:Fungal-trans domain-containing protein n=1 Tax=Mycena sanguinolenta TaxID=230812 RepID=A0A8H6YMB9_9AGAR|nr:Fungal-trans domain-containing protein [Mycena sanguinolenta]